MVQVTMQALELAILIQIDKTLVPLAYLDLPLAPDIAAVVLHLGLGTGYAYDGDNGWVRVLVHWLSFV